MKYHYTNGKETLKEYYKYLDTIGEDKIKQQYERQENKILETEEKYENDKKNKSFSDITVGTIILKNSISRSFMLLNKFIEQDYNKRQTVLNNAKSFFTTSILNDDLESKRLLKNDEIIYIANKVIFNNLYNDKKTIGSIAIEVYNNILIAMKDKVIEIKATAWHKKVKENTKTNNLVMRNRMIDRTEKLLDIPELNQLPKLSKDNKLKIGMILISFLVNTGFINKFSRTIGCKTEEQLVFHEDLEKQVENLHDIFKFSKISYEPMVIKPMPWVDIIGGGFLNNDLVSDINKDIDFELLNNKIARVRTKEALKNLRKNNMDDVYESLNTLQNTSWKINKFTLNVVNKIWEDNMNIGGIIKSQPLPLPENIDKETFIGTEEEFNEAIKKFRVKSAYVHTENNRSLGERITFEQKLKIVNNLKSEKNIYFPYNLDFRGRIYSIPVLINPQGDDVSKGLLKFSEGKKLGNNGLKWLKVHCANVFGYDKESFENRVKWVDEKIDMFKDIINNPFNNQFWTEADKPIQFLAVVYEIAEAYNLDNPEDYISYIPVAMDGSCSGIQHYSAMLKDEIGGKGVNLVPNNKPQDIYKMVSDRVEEILKDIIKTGKTNIKQIKGPLLKSNAVMWLESPYMNRSLTKRPVMTTPYGVVKFGMLNQIREYFKEKKKKGEKINDMYLTKESISYITEIIDVAIKEVVIAARTGMDYIQNNLNNFFKLNKNLTTFKWVTPLGFTVTQNYNKSSEKRIHTFFGSIKCLLSIKEDINKVDINRQTNGIAPNFIHSLDATHLMKTVLGMKGITKSFAVIHDSFGVHACDTEELRSVINKEFVKLYSETDRLLDLGNTIKKQDLSNKFELTPLPEYGNLDLQKTEQSEYLFG